MSDDDSIVVYGAREHNLKNINVSIPRDKITVITGLSGSGKSSLAFDTIYAEGQRRYMETMSAYARQFLGNMERPDVDKITGLSPVISIEQKTTNRNPRSTVGTVSEIYDFMRLLFARASEAYSYNTGEKMVKYTIDKIRELILTEYTETKIVILSPVVKGRKGHYRELFETILRKGFLYVRIDGEIKEISHGMQLDRYKNHDIEIVVDRIKVKADENDIKRLFNSIDLAMKHGGGTLIIHNFETLENRYYSKTLMCPTTSISYSEPAPHSFSFNSPSGACPKCNGLGNVNVVDVDKLIPNKLLSIKKGGIEPLGSFKNMLIFWQIDALLKKYGHTIDEPLNNFSQELIDKILFGSDESLKLENTLVGLSSNYFMSYEGIAKFIEEQAAESTSAKVKTFAESFIRKAECPVCCGARLKKESLYFKIDDKNISEMANMELGHLYNWLIDIELRISKRNRLIAIEILKEIRTRLQFLIDIGLDYLSLNRPSGSLSGGESQRIRLATQIGSKLVNVLYILDEPSIGLHQRDNIKLIKSLKELRDAGNSVIVVEHDKDMMLEADYIVDMGPGAGRHGGEIIGAGTPAEFLKMDSITAQFLSNKVSIEVPEKRREGNGLSLKIFGATGNNLKSVDVEFPLGKFICITGVSGSGKSTLLNATLQPILSKHFYRSTKEPLAFSHIEGLENIDKVITVNQSPIGRTPRSNPATYTGLFTDIRKIYEMTSDAKIRGFKAGRFSFNVKGGRCETCSGAGLQTIEMNFLPDVYVKCKECNGLRYNRETLQVKFKGKSISQVLDMTINQAAEFFVAVPAIYSKLLSLQNVGLGYITLGQPSTTLSGGESQRVKLATEMAKKDTGKTLYILDEPTTGLHFQDIKQLLGVIQKLSDRGNTVIVIEHNLDVIKTADHIIDIGPEGGNGGGKVVCEGTPEQVAQINAGYTASFLLKELINN